jgi:hypothetical protein
MDVEATTAVRQAEVTAAKTMIDRTADTFEVSPSRLAADTGYGSAEMLGWLVNERAIEPHIPVFDKSERTDGTFSRADFLYDQEGDLYICPTGKQLRKHRRLFAVPRSGVTKDNTVLYRASQRDCGACALKAKCCPNTPARKFRAPSTKLPATRPAPSPRPRLTSSHVESERRSRCCSPTSNASSDSTAYDYEAPAALTMSSSSPPPPRTYGNWPS